MFKKYKYRFIDYILVLVKKKKTYILTDQKSK